MLWMVIGCVLPLLLIFLAPALGIRKDISLFIFIAAMFACHLLMPMHHHEGHDRGREHSTKEESTLKSGNHEHHQH